MRVRVSKPVNGLNGFVRIRRTGCHATLWVEGRDDQEPSVAAIAMTKAQVESLRRKLDGLLQHWPKTAPPLEAFMEDGVVP